MQKKTVKALQILEKEIIAGNIGINGLLPPERELCQQFDIGRGSLQAVFAELTARKLIRKIPGKGMRILTKDEKVKNRKFMTIIPEGSVKGAEIFEMLRGIVTAADRESAEVILFFYNPETSGRKLLNRLDEGSIDGVIMVERCYEDVIERLRVLEIPFVVANYERQMGNMPVVQVDFRQVGRMAGRFLVQKGHRHIGFISNRADSFLYRELFAGLKGALAEDDLVPESSLCIEAGQDVNAPSVRQKLISVLKSHAGNLPHIAFFAGRDRYAGLIYSCCRELGLAVPEDVSVIGYDNVTWTDGERERLTTICQPVFKGGQAAFGAVCQAAAEGREVNTVTLAGELVLRESVKNLVS